MTFDCKVYQYDERSERWQLRATYAEPIAAHVDGDGIAIPASDFDGPAVRAGDSGRAAERAVGFALEEKCIEPDPRTERGMRFRVFVASAEGVRRGYEVALRVEVEGADMLDSDATAALTGRRNE